MPASIEPSYRRSHGLVDLLDRVLDKGLVIAGDIRVSLAEVELLTIRVRLLVCSIDKAQEIGLDWWLHDPSLSAARRGLLEENETLRGEIRSLETRLAALEGSRGSAELSSPSAAERTTAPKTRKRQRREVDHGG